MSTPTHDNWHDAAWAAANLARHTGIACGASRSGGHTTYHQEMAFEELTRVAEAMGFALVKRTPAASPAVTIMPLDPEEEAA